MSALTEWAGLAEILLEGSILATGSCHLVVEKLRSQGAPGQGEPTQEILASARGTIRLDKGDRAHRAMDAGPVRVRLGGAIELRVDVHLYVPTARFLAFTCSDVTGIEGLLTRQAPPESA